MTMINFTEAYKDYGNCTLLKMPFFLQMVQVNDEKLTVAYDFLPDWFDLWLLSAVQDDVACCLLFGLLSKTINRATLKTATRAYKR